MFKNLFLKKESIEQISFPEVDVALKLMFEMAMIDGTLDKTELELIKKRVREIAPEDTTVSSVIKKMIDQSMESVSLYPTVKKINDSYEKKEKEELLKVLWQLVAVDKSNRPIRRKFIFQNSRVD